MAMDGEITIILFDLLPLFEYSFNFEEFSDVIERRISPIKIFNDNIKKINFAKKLISSVINSIFLLIVMLFFRSGTLVTGVPLLTHRLARAFSFGLVKSISLLRGVVAYTTPETSTSTKLITTFKKVPFSIEILKKLKLLEFDADYIICNGPVTSKFLKERSISGTIKTIGPLDADRLLLNIQDEETQLSDKAPMLAYLTSAYAWHNDYEAAEMQFSQIYRIVDEITEEERYKSINLEIIVHPRDNFSAYESRFGGNSRIHISQYGLHGATKVDKKRTMFISIASTMSFELDYLGYRSYFFVDETLYNKYQPWYEATGVSPLKSLSEVLELTLAPFSESEKKPLNSVFVTQNRKHVREAWCELLREVLL